MSMFAHLSTTDVLSSSLHRASAPESGSPGSSAESTDVPGVTPSAGSATAMRERPAPPRMDRLPPWKVVLHNDDESDMLFVVDTIVVLGVANRHAAILRMLEAHETGSSLLIMTHRERAELLQEQFNGKGMTVTIEPA